MTNLELETCYAIKRIEQELRTLNANLERQTKLIEQLIEQKQ